MEKRKAISLNRYFITTLLLFFIGIAVICILMFFTLMLGMQIGFIMPANTGEKEVRAEIARQREIGKFTNDLNSSFYQYVYFDKDGNIESSSLKGNALQKEVNKYKNDDVTYATGTYLFFEDGSRCLFTWRYVASYANSVLQQILPDAETTIFCLVIILSIIFFILVAHNRGKKLSKKLALVEMANEQIAKQDLDTPIDSSSGIKEFNHALQSIDDMRIALKDALIKQWESEQQRQEEIVALAHDIKTPLTIINGNAELLLEDLLNPNQIKLADSIHSAGIRAQQYISVLQQISNLEVSSNKTDWIFIHAILNELDTILAPLAKNKSIKLDYIYSKSLCNINVNTDLLVRALINIGENAIQYSLPNSKITINVIQSETETIFSMQDEGVGFSASALQHAKEIFWQQDKSRTPSNNYGIGLAIAEKVAQMHSGQLVLENTDQGAFVRLSVKNT